MGYRHAINLEVKHDKYSTFPKTEVISKTKRSFQTKKNVRGVYIEAVAIKCLLHPGFRLIQKEMQGVNPNCSIRGRVWGTRFRKNSDGKKQVTPIRSARSPYAFQGFT